MILFIAMAIATTTILVVGTLAAADIINFGRRETPTSDDHAPGRRSLA